ncbi:MAG TPA: MarR family transcriptional regulator [Candidatus Acidoferrum sp.]|nr:MarR family transcriptional regulator [Candidatus Acidoferrum sp.]
MRPRADKPARDASAFDEERSSSIGYLIRSASKHILAQLQQRLEPHDVTLGQYFVLRELWENEGITQRELSARIGVQEPGTVAAIDAMEKRDLVLRVRSKQDRRKIHVYLTARGRGLRHQLLGYARDVIDEAMADFSREEVETLRSLLQRLKARLEARSEETE